MELLTWLIICALGVLAIFFLIAYILSFKHKFTAKFVSGGKIVQVDYKCREVKDKETKNWFWKPRGKGLVMFAKPPENCLLPNFRKKGSWCASGYVNREGEIIQFIEDCPEPGNERIKPFTIEQRTVVVNQFRKVAEKRGGFWEKWGKELAFFTFMIVAIVVFVMYIDNFKETVSEDRAIMRQYTMTMAEKQLNITQSLERMVKITEQSCGNVQFVT